MFNILYLYLDIVYNLIVPLLLTIFVHVCRSCIQCFPQYHHLPMRYFQKYSESLTCNQLSLTAAAHQHRCQFCELVSKLSEAHPLWPSRHQHSLHVVNALRYAVIIITVLVNSCSHGFDDAHLLPQDPGTFQSQ